ncbi:MAG: sialate O-acetylesterase, partial [Opitutales bacterium]
QAKESAPPKSELRAILWLQGESDARNAEQVAAYEAQLLDLIDRYRRDLGDPKLPFIACTIGSFIADGTKAKRFPFSESINEILLSLPEKREHTACIDARDIKGHIGDHLHYNADAQIEIGRRFAKAYLILH